MDNAVSGLKVVVPFAVLNHFTLAPLLGVVTKLAIVGLAFGANHCEFSEIRLVVIAKRVGLS